MKKKIIIGALVLAVCAVVVAFSMNSEQKKEGVNASDLKNVRFHYR